MPRCPSRLGTEAGDCGSNRRIELIVLRDGAVKVERKGTEFHF